MLKERNQAAILCRLVTLLQLLVTLCHQCPWRPQVGNSLNLQHIYLFYHPNLKYITPSLSFSLVVLFFPHSCLNPEFHFFPGTSSHGLFFHYLVKRFKAHKLGPFPDPIYLIVSMLESMGLNLNIESDFLSA